MRRLPHAVLAVALACSCSLKAEVHGRDAGADLPQGSGGTPGSGGAAGSGGTGSGGSGSGGLTGSGGSGSGGITGSGGVTGSGGGGLDAAVEARPGCTTASYGGHSYVFCGQTTSTWYEATADCSARGMHVIGIDDAAENDWVQSQAAASSALSANKDLWLGGTDAVVEGEWRWPDGRLFWQGSTAVSGVFTSWRNGEPDSATGNEDCLLMSLKTKTWLDFDCFAAFSAFFGCESF